MFKEKGSRVLHVAAKAGQLYQVELLFINGADIMGWDSLGNTAAHVARYLLFILMFQCYYLGMFCGSGRE